MPRSPALAFLSALALLALAACAEQQASAPPPVAVSEPLSSDQGFIDRADNGTGSEIELGRLGRSRAQSAAVRAFATRILTDHRQAHSRLATIEQRIRMLPAEPPPPQGQLAAQFATDFDRKFVADQVKNHQEAIQLFETEARTGQDPRLRKYASDNLPMLYRNLQEAQALAAHLGG